MSSSTHTHTHTQLFSVSYSHYKSPFYQLVFKIRVDNIQESNVLVLLILPFQADHELSWAEHKSSVTAEDKKMKITLFFFHQY